MNKLYDSEIWLTVHEEPPPPPPDNGGVKLDDKQQEFVNGLIAKEKKAFQDQLKRTMDEIGALKTRANLTQKERDELDQRMSQVNATMLTQEEKHKQQVEELRGQLDSETKRLSTERDQWQQRFSSHVVTSTIVNEAAGAKAYNPHQLVAILNTSTSLIEELDSGGKPIGKLVPIVKFDDKDKDGKPVTLQLSVSDAVKRMTKLPEFANLFNQGGAGGMGGTGKSGSGSGGNTTLSDVAKDPAAYRNARKQGMKL